MNKIKVIKKDELLTREWAGGTTTELYIYPENELYENRNFKFRISSAKVESDESDFTKLPNIKRKIMILDGTIKLVHENQHSITLEKYQQDTFYGHWDTKSYGKVTDFNLMLNEDTDGIIEYINLKNQKGISCDYDCRFENLKEIFYVVNGKVNICIGNESEEIEAGDVILINNNNKLNISLKNKWDSNSDLIRTKIHY